jgi:hypothetical protein
MYQEKGSISDPKEDDFLIKQAKKLNILDKDELLIKALKTKVDSRGRLRDDFGRFVQRCPKGKNTCQKKSYLPSKKRQYTKV